MNIYCFLISDITHGIFKNRWPACFTRCQSDSKSLIADRWDRISLQRTGVWSVAKSGKLWVFSRWRRAHTSLTAPHFISGTNILTVGLVRSEPKKRFAFAFNSSGIKSGGACSSSATASVIDSSWFVHVFHVHLFYIRKLSDIAHGAKQLTSLSLCQYFIQTCHLSLKCLKPPMHAKDIHIPRIIIHCEFLYCESIIWLCGWEGISR